MATSTQEKQAIEHITSKDFIYALSNEKPIIMFCHYKAEASESKKIKLVLEAIKKDLPLLPVYEFIVDENEANIELAENVGITKTPILLCYKDGSLSRYKDNNFSKSDVLKFIGNSNIYKDKQVKRNEQQNLEGLM